MRTAPRQPRLGLAVPRSVGTAVIRNGVKRKLRAAWDELGDAVPAGRDYVLVARPGLAEAAQAQGHDWLARAGGRRARQGGGVKLPRYLGIALVYAWRYTLGLLTPAGTCKYHPSCSQYAIDALRAHGLVKGSASRRGASSAATRGATAASTTRADATLPPPPPRARMIVGACIPLSRSRTCSRTSSSGCTRAAG